VEGKSILSEVVVDKVMYRRFETVVLYLAYGRTGETYALIGRKIGERGRRRNNFRTLLIPAFLTLRFLCTRLIEPFLLGRGGGSWDGREGEEGDEEEN